MICIKSGARSFAINSKSPGNLRGARDDDVDPELNGRVHGLIEKMGRFFQTECENNNPNKVCRGTAIGCGNAFFYKKFFQRSADNRGRERTANDSGGMF